MIKVLATFELECQNLRQANELKEEFESFPSGTYVGKHPRLRHQEFVARYTKVEIKNNINESDFQWVAIKSHKQASFFHALGARHLRFGPEDSRERELIICGTTANAIDDGGGSEISFENHDLVEVYLDVNKLRKYNQGLNQRFPEPGGTI